MYMYSICKKLCHIKKKEGILLESLSTLLFF